MRILMQKTPAAAYNTVMPKRKTKRRVRWLRLLILMCILTTSAFLSIVYLENREGRPEPFSQCQGWNLLLVNRDHPLPEGYEPTLLKLSNGQYVDERIYPELQAMFDEARSQGIRLYVRSGYRSNEKQQELFAKRKQTYLDKGMSEEEAEAETKKWVSVPGTSEHETGLAVDINTEKKRLTQQTADWLHMHAAEYGFVQRYEESKSALTGVNNEPWHYRYVGAEAARQMAEGDLCLEEYVARGCWY